MLAYILTLGKSSANSRNWIYTGQIVMLLVEITLMTTEDPLPEWFFPSTTEHEVSLMVWTPSARDERKERSRALKTVVRC